MGRSMPRQLSALAAALLLACRRCCGRRLRPRRSNCPGSAAARPALPAAGRRLSSRSALRRPRYDDPVRRARCGRTSPTRPATAPRPAAGPGLPPAPRRVTPTARAAAIPTTARPAAATTTGATVPTMARPERRLQSAESSSGRTGSPTRPMTSAGLRPPLRPAALQQRGPPGEGYSSQRDPGGRPRLLRLDQQGHGERHRIRLPAAGPAQRLHPGPGRRRRLRRRPALRRGHPLHRATRAPTGSTGRVPRSATTPARRAPR